MLLAQIDDLVTGAAAALGLVHRRIGILQKLVRKKVATARIGDADAGRHLHLDSGKDERRGDRIHHPGRDRFDLGRLVEVFTQDDKFVARHARQCVPRPQDRGEPPRHRHQQLVTDGMAVHVVDMFELVEIGEEDGSKLVGSAAA